MKKILLVLAATVAFWLLPPSEAESPDSAGLMTVRVEVTGETESGLPWDGRNTYFLPAQMSYSSPPELVLCLVTDKDYSCILRDVQKLLPVCPERNWCEFEGINLTSSDKPFGMVVFDLDAVGYETIKNASARLDRLLGSGDGDPDSITGSAKSWAKGTISSVEQSNEQRLEFVDAIVFSPHPRHPGVKPLKSRIRALVNANAPMGNGGDLEKDRIAGPIITKTLDDCMFPAPECRLDYSYLQIIPEMEWEEE